MLRKILSLLISLLIGLSNIIQGIPYSKRLQSFYKDLNQVSNPFDTEELFMNFEIYAKHSLMELI